MNCDEMFGIIVLLIVGILMLIFIIPGTPE